MIRYLVPAKELDQFVSALAIQCSTEPEDSEHTKMLAEYFLSELEADTERFLKDALPVRQFDAFRAKLTSSSSEALLKDLEKMIPDITGKLRMICTRMQEYFIATN